MLVAMPYGSTRLSLEVPDDRVAGVLVPAYPKAPDGAQAVEAALSNPIDSMPLRDLSRGKRNIVVLSPDHTRAMPSRLTMPPLLAEIAKGNPEAEITVLIATGLHRAPTRRELDDRYGSGVLGRVRVAVHDPDDEGSHVTLGSLPSGAPLQLDRRALEADLLVSEGLIEPHFFAGYSGGRKNVLPGVAGRRSVYHNHSASLIGYPMTSAGSLEGNPVAWDMDAAAERAGLAFILNVCADDKRNVIGAFAGHPLRAHRAGCEFLSRVCTVGPAVGDITVVTNGGYPLDQNLYQAVKGMYTASRTTREGGVIVCLAECRDGVGGESFYDLVSSAASPQALLEAISRVPSRDTVMDQWEAQVLAQVLCKQSVILVSDNIVASVARAMHLGHARDLDEAMKVAESMVGDRARVTVIPDGVQVIVNG